jgi:hypothetical protein
MDKPELQIFIKNLSPHRGKFSFEKLTVTLSAKTLPSFPEHEVSLCFLSQNSVIGT